jgi:hypothetical protein
MSSPTQQVARGNRRNSLAEPSADTESDRRNHAALWTIVSPLRQSITASAVTTATAAPYSEPPWTSDSCTDIPRTVMRNPAWVTDSASRHHPGCAGALHLMMRRTWQEATSAPGSVDRASQRGAGLSQDRRRRSDGRRPAHTAVDRDLSATHAASGTGTGLVANGWGGSPPVSASRPVPTQSGNP